MLRIRFEYAFVGEVEKAGSEFGEDDSGLKFGSRPVLRSYAVEGGGCYEIGGMEVVFMRQDHGFSESLGLRIGDFAYSTDVVRLSEENYESLRGVKTWIVDCLRFRSHPTHMNYEEVLQAIEKLGVERAYFTHMNNDMDYETLCRLLPSHVRPAYDGLCIRI
jgi:phosphoribosyl 1,2-cyclic phosphate phosphodiesterase